MALSFNGIEPVIFGGKECTPKIDAELKMRLSALKEYDVIADKTLAEAFPDDETYVHDFLSKRMTAVEKMKLHAYLMGGDAMVEEVMKRFEKSIDESIEEEK